MSEMTREQTIREAVARGWCDPANSHKEMDSILAESIVREILALDLTARSEGFREALQAARAWLESDEGRTLAEIIAIDDSSLASSGKHAWNHQYIDMVRKVEAALTPPSPNDVLAPGERKPGEIAGSRNDAARHGVSSQERVSNPVEDTPPDGGERG